MINEEIIANKKLIAEFRGLKQAKKARSDKSGVWVNPKDYHHPSEIFNTYVINKTHFILVNDLKYNSSWDWLMPVVEKIETTKWDISNYQSSYDKKHNRTEAVGEINIFYDDREEFKGWTIHVGFSFGRDIGDFTERYKTKIEATYKAVIEFIKWYNNHKKSKL